MKFVAETEVARVASKPMNATMVNLLVSIVDGFICFYLIVFGNEVGLEFVFIVSCFIRTQIPL